MLYRHFRRVPALEALYRASIPARAAIKANRVLPYLEPNSRVLDVGSGNGGVAQQLIRSGHDLTCLDLRDGSFFPETRPVLYDGGTFPFPNKHFDVALLLTMLHHVPFAGHKSLLREAARCAERLLVIEDVYEGRFMRHLTHFTDSLVNLEFAGHPHAHRSEADWVELFEGLGLRVEDRFAYRVMGVFWQVGWVLG